MNHADHVRLICDGIPVPSPSSPEHLSPPPIWADLGSGHGAFTLALADILPPNAEIYSVDRDASALHEQERAMRAQFPHANVHYLPADFTRSLALPPLDGVLMANSLHFHRRKEPILAQIQTLLKPGGRLILVEYDTDRGNHWVPYPLSYSTWETLATRAGFANTRLLTTQPSRFLGRMFSAVSFAP
ncbi:MAG: methyltransferase domain-containing protein [Anaerolineales bacterium]|nr:methyltransferase domain-containing protein [Anaerolineales bacterium]